MLDPASLAELCKLDSFLLLLIRSRRLSEAKRVRPKRSLEMLEDRNQAFFKLLLENYIDPELLVENERMQYVFYTLRDLMRR